MNKRFLIGIAVIVIIVASGGVYWSNKAKDEKAMIEKQTMEQAEMEKENAMMDKSSDSAMMKDEQVMMKSGSYEPFAPSKIALASASRDVVLFFRASWCPTCKAVDTDIKAHLKDIPENLILLNVDYDNSTDLKKKYGVTYQHTFVQVDSQGNLIHKWSGSQNLAALVAEVK
jgi:thiol-disulfide isomerase/thioredoxin